MWTTDVNMREQQDKLHVRKITAEDMEYVKVDQDKMMKGQNKNSNGVTLDISQQAKEMYQKQIDAEREARDDEDELSVLGKLIEIARRISKGDKVSPLDEKKLMEFSTELYQIAKAAAMLHKNRKNKEHDSLFEEEWNRELEDKIRVLNQKENVGEGNREVNTEINLSVRTEGMIMDVSIS